MGKERHRVNKVASEEQFQVAKEDRRKLKDDLAALKEIFATMMKGKMVEDSGKPLPPSREGVRLTTQPEVGA